jgi:Alkylmercury lyase
VEQAIQSTATASRACWERLRGDPGLHRLYQFILSAVVVYGYACQRDDTCTAAEVMCPNTTFHASRGSADAYLASRPGIDGQVLDQQSAVEYGRRIFGSLLDGPA